MSRKVVFTSAVVALTSSLALFAEPKVRPDPAGPAPVVADQTNPPNQVVQAGRVNQAPQVAVQAGGQQAGGQWNWKNPDHALASCVALGNQEEIALSEFAAQKSQNDDVKKFAQMMIHDHQEFLQKIGQFAPEASAAGYLNMEPQQAGRTPGAAGNPVNRNAVQQAAVTTNVNNGAAIQVTAGTRPAGEMAQGAHHLQIEREIAQQCLAMSKEKLSSENGAQFDKCYIGQQIAMHMGMKAKLTVFQRHASSQLAPVLAAGLKKTDEHLAKAESIMKGMDHSATSSNATGDSKTTTNAKAATNKQ